MSNTILLENSQLDVPIVAVYAACLIEEKISTNNFLSLLNSLTNLGNSKEIKFENFKKQISMRQDFFSIPFTRNVVDQAMLIASTPQYSNSSFKVFSDASNVSLGYLIVKENEYVYRDRPDTALEDDKKISEALNSIDVTLGIKELLKIDKNKDFAYGPEAGDSVINFDAPSLNYCFKNSTSVYIELFILRCNESDATKTIKRKLSVGKLDKINKNNFSIVLPPSQTMELHAASINGNSILIESSNNFRLVFKLPDLTNPNDRSYLKIEPTVVFQKLFGLHNPEKVAVDSNVAIELYIKYKWFTFTSPEEWFQANNSIQPLNN